MRNEHKITAGQVIIKLTYTGLRIRFSKKLITVETWNVIDYNS